MTGGWHLTGSNLLRTLWLQNRVALRAYFIEQDIVTPSCIEHKAIGVITYQYYHQKKGFNCHTQHLDLCFSHWSFPQNSYLVFSSLTALWRLLAKAHCCKSLGYFCPNSYAFVVFAFILTGSEHVNTEELWMRGKKNNNKKTKSKKRDKIWQKWHLENVWGGHLDLESETKEANGGVDTCRATQVSAPPPRGVLFPSWPTQRRQSVSHPHRVPCTPVCCHAKQSVCPPKWQSNCSTHTQACSLSYHIKQYFTV